MKKTYMVIIGLLALCALLVMMNSAMAAAGIHLGSQNGAKHGDNTNADVIFITGQSATIHDIFDDADVTTAHMSEISSKHRYLLNCSIQVNETGILIIEPTTCDWLMLSSIDGAIANITCYGRMFINTTLITGVIPSTGGLNGSTNDTAYATGAKTRPSIRANNSEAAGDSRFGFTGRVAYLGGALNESYGGICINDTGGTPVFTSAGGHISYCYTGLFLKSIMSGTAVTQLNITNCDVYGLKIDADSAMNFTNCNFTNSGTADIYTHSDVVSTLNNTGGLGAKTIFYSGGDINNISQKFRVISRSRGNTAWNLMGRDIRFTVSDNDYVNLNMTNAGFGTQTFTGETLDTDFLNIVWPGMPRTNYYQLVVDGALYTYTNPDANWYLTFNYTGTWSTKNFDIEAYAPGSAGGAGDVDPDLKWYYKCVNGKLVSAQFTEAPAGWSLTRPTCGSSGTTVSDGTGGGADVYGYDVDDNILFGIIIACAAVFGLLAFVPQTKSLVKKKEIREMLIVAAIIIIILIGVGWLLM